MKNKVISVLITVILGGIVGWRFLTQTDRVQQFVENETYSDVSVERIYKDSIFTITETCSIDDASFFSFSGKKGDEYYNGEICCNDIFGVFETCYFIDQKKINSSK